MEIANFSTTALMKMCKSTVYTANTHYNPFCTRTSNSFRAEIYKNNSFYTEQREKETKKGKKKQDEKNN